MDREGYEMMKMIDQRFSLSFSYPVIFSDAVFSPENPVLAETINRLDEKRVHRVLAFVDEGLEQARPELMEKIETFFQSQAGHIELVRPPTVVPGGEAIKNDYRMTMQVVDQILEYRLCRHSFVLIIGGGAVLDAVGFAASIVHRGLRVLRLPTTVLSQNDAGVGIKNGMNLHGGKNTIGVFQPPFAVINDFSFLESLTMEHWISGVAEAFKVAVIKDKAFFHFLCENATRFAQRDASAMRRLIQRCAELHLDHIRSSGDPFELGHARPLDFGHWAAHKLEQMTGYRLSHGQAVAIGMAMDAGYAVEKGLLDPSDYQALIEGLEMSGFILWVKELGRRLGDGRFEIFGGLDEFREHLGGELCVTLPDGLGRKIEVHQMDEKILTTLIERLADRAVNRTVPV